MSVNPREVSRLAEKLEQYDAEVRLLPGVEDHGARDALAAQLVESTRRVRFVQVVGRRPISPRRADPHDSMFDPIRAAWLHKRSDSLDEAFWCVFLFVHFGRHATGGYRYIRDVYGRLGEGNFWSWEQVSVDPDAFSSWVSEQAAAIRDAEQPGGFGNHRKYERLEDTGRVVQTYVDWVRPPRTHIELVEEAVKEGARDRYVAFETLFRSMNAVYRFGRLARFDYCAMLGKLELAPIAPGATYFDESSGPQLGTQLLFGKEQVQAFTVREVEEWLRELAAYLQTGLQELEDALCNWQKNPGEFRPFRG